MLVTRRHLRTIFGIGSQGAIVMVLTLSRHEARGCRRARRRRAQKQFIVQAGRERHSGVAGVNR